ncbi:hypothetical protein CRG98_037746 [Punica granatum]|uniref:Uncharacterized protein n=1 Tax=Punica granatum TaxID=22663 RepID=A0A2I0IEU1_PUNGR|nr:hypothetical protein CRG98_037746 [Punica granatum]
MSAAAGSGAAESSTDDSASAAENAWRAFSGCAEGCFCSETEHVINERGLVCGLEPGPRPRPSLGFDNIGLERFVGIIRPGGVGKLRWIAPIGLGWTSPGLYPSVVVIEQIREPDVRATFM